MISAKDTVYPLIKEEITSKEIFDCFTPTEDEIVFCKNETRTDANFTCMLVLLKSFQRYGYAVLLKEIPNKIVSYIIDKTDVNLSGNEIEEYDLSRIRRHHISVIKNFMGIKSFSDSGENMISSAFYELAKSREDTADIINGGIDTLIRERYELPAFSTLFRLCQHQKSKVYKEIFKNITNSLDVDERTKIDTLFTYPSLNSRSNWDRIKFEIPNGKAKSIKKLEEHIIALSSWDTLVKKLEKIPFNKLTQFAAEAYASDLKEITEIEEKKRYTLALSLIKMQKSKSIDNLIKIFQK